jgi:chromosome segregation ATPase
LNLRIGGLQPSDLFAESNDKLHEYRAAMKRIKNTAAMAEGSLAALLEKRDIFKTENEKMKTENECLKAKVVELTTYLEEATTQKEEADLENFELSFGIEDVTVDLEEARDRLNDSLADNKELRMEIDRLRDQMESARYDADLHICVQNKNSDRLEEKVKMDADKFAALKALLDSIE